MVLSKCAMSSDEVRHESAEVAAGTRAACDGETAQGIEKVMKSER